MLQSGLRDYRLRDNWLTPAQLDDLFYGLVLQRVENVQDSTSIVRSGSKRFLEDTSRTQRIEIAGKEFQEQALTLRNRYHQQAKTMWMQGGGVGALQCLLFDTVHVYNGGTPDLHVLLGLRDEHGRYVTPCQGTSSFEIIDDGCCLIDVSTDSFDVSFVIQPLLCQRAWKSSQRSLEQFLTENSNSPSWIGSRLSGMVHSICDRMKISSEGVEMVHGQKSEDAFQFQFERDPYYPGEVCFHIEVNYVDTWCVVAFNATFLDEKKS